jgi:hypothetical protein
MMECFMTVWNILRQFGIMYGRLVYVMCGHLVIFHVFGMFEPRKMESTMKTYIRKLGYADIVCTADIMFWDKTK